ncbi:MAG: TetR/AcrR family transcriptional regulator, partial [Novosphingobium sp.]|nr:TetR/AcrR family transcriptional regulator [Novosphingobium sp.]
ILARDGSGSAERLPIPAVPEAGPPPPAHIRKLLDVAGTHFLESGYQSASLDVIGAEAAVGRGTLYRHFGNKAGLFAAAMRDQAQAIAGRAKPPSLPAGEAPLEALIEFLEASLLVLAGERSIAVHRTVIAESRRDPELARDIYAILREPWLQVLTAWLESLRAAGKVRLHDPVWYARQALVLSLRGNRVIAAGQALTPAEARQAAEHASAIFLRGFVAAL